MRALKGAWGPTLSAALAAVAFLALESPTRTQEAPAEPDLVRGIGAAGTLNGTVHDVDVDEGIIEVEAEGRVVRLRARPFDLAALRPGDDVSLRYSSFGDALWLTPLLLDVMPAPVPGVTQTATGPVEAIDEESARIVVGGTVFRVHPAQLPGLEPGQLVSVSYGQFDGESWVASISPVTGAATGPPAGIGAENYVPGSPTEGRGPGAPVGTDSFQQPSYPVSGYSTDVYLPELGPIGNEPFPPEEADDDEEEAAGAPSR